MERLLSLCLVALLLPASAARAQVVTTDDLFALQDALYDASRDVAALKAADAELSARLQRELDAARDEAVYLRVKFRKDGSVTRAEYQALRSRIEDIRMRARGESGPVPSGSVAPGPVPSTPPPGDVAMADAPAPVPVTRPAGCGPYDVCVGQELDVRLQTPLNSDTAQVEDRFEATTIVPFYNEDHELIPAGSLLMGVVSGVDRAARVDRRGSLTLAFEKMIVRGKTYEIRALVTGAIQSKGLRGEIAKITAGAGVGAMIGGVLGGVGGAIAGMAIGAGGVLIATEGNDVKVPAGTLLRIRFDAPVTVR